MTDVEARRGGGPPAFVPLDPPGAPMTAAALVSRVVEERREHAARPHVLVNMITTVDGRATISGSTSALGAEGDLELLVELRTAADAILVGTRTIEVEGYGRFMSSRSRRERRAAAGLAPDPPAVLVSRRFEVPWSAGLFDSPEQPVIVYTESEGAPPAVKAPVEVVRLPDCTLPAVLADLARRGIRLLVCEGGPTLLHALLAAGLVDELFVTVSATLTGDSLQPTILTGLAFPAPLAPRLASVHRRDDELFLRYVL